MCSFLKSSVYTGQDISQIPRGFLVLTELPGGPEFPSGEIAGSHPVIITIFPTFSYIFSKVRPFFKKYEGGLSLS